MGRPKWPIVDVDCAFCGKTFVVKPSRIRQGVKYCCRDHYRKAKLLEPPKKTLHERFWEKVNKDGPIPEHCPELGPCWIWLGAKAKGKFPYGMIGVRGAKWMVHAQRVSWEIHYGEIPEGHFVLHK